MNLGPFGLQIQPPNNYVTLSLKICSICRRSHRLVGAWCAKRNDRNQWLRIDLRGPTRITKVTTQGRDDATQFVRTYYLYYSQNGRTFLPIKEGGKIRVCETSVI